MKKKIISLVLTLLVIVTAFCACKKEDANTELPSDKGTTLATENTDKDKTSEAFFSSFESETIDGEKVTDEVFKKNKVTMVNVWGTFCSPCINEMPDLQKLSEDFEDKGVKLIGIIVDAYDSTKKEVSTDKVAAAESIIKQTGVKYMNILPSESLNKAKLDYIFSVPTTYFLNEKGEIIGSEYVGSRSYDDWSRILADMLEKA